MKKRKEIEGVVAPKIVAYAEKHSTPPCLESRKLAEITETMPDADMASGQTICSLLKMLVQSMNAAEVLEIGTFRGASALAMAKGLPPLGTLTTIDICYRDTAIDAWIEAQVFNKITYLNGDAREIVPTLEDTFNFAFVDGDKFQYEEYFALVILKMRQGALIAFDDTLREGRIVHPRRKDDRAMDRFNKMLAKDPRVEVLPLTIGDGLTLARVK